MHFLLLSSFFFFLFFCVFVFVLYALYTLITRILKNFGSQTLVLKMLELLARYSGSQSIKRLSSTALSSSLISTQNPQYQIKVHSRCEMCQLGQFGKARLDCRKIILQVCCCSGQLHGFRGSKITFCGQDDCYQ